jgi:xylanolytic transcriptional activator XlnR
MSVTLHRSDTHSAQSQTPGLDTLAESSEYALEQLRLAREAELDDASSTKTDHHKSASPSADIPDFKIPVVRNHLSDARSSIRKHSDTAAVRRRISRACDQCNQLRTKCDGQTPCAHCSGE